MRFLKIRFLSIAVIVLSITMFLSWNSPAKAWLFNPITQISTTSFLKFKIDFSILQDIKLFQQKFQFSTLALKKTFASCEDAASVCEREYKRCLGLIKYSDQESAEILFKLKNACVNSCSEPEECFGLDLSSGTIPLSTQSGTAFTPACTGAQTIVCQTPEGLTGTKTAITCNALTKQWNFGVCEPDPIQTCSGPDTRSCTTAFGSPGTQQGMCNTATGQYDWGTCVADTVNDYIEVVACPPPAPTCPVGYSGSYYCSNGSWVNGCAPIVPQCDSNQPQCPIGYLGSYTCQSGQWVNNCYLPTCSGEAPSCPSGYSGFYVCQNGQWINQCQAPETCTSFTYSAWSACVNGTQTRTVTASNPTGCTGGSPILSQSCTVPCQGNQPSCPLGNYGSYTCENGTWVNNCYHNCTGSPPACPTGWSGSYVCAYTYWANLCVPPGPDYCYRGVQYRMDNGAPYAKCLGALSWETCNVGGVTKRYMLNECPWSQQYNSWSTESGIKTYIDTMYSYTIPNSCDPSFNYTQCIVN